MVQYSARHNRYHFLGAAKSRKHETTQKGYEIGGKPVNELNRGKVDYVKNTIDVHRLVQEELSSLSVDAGSAFNYSGRGPVLGEPESTVEKMLALGAQKAIYDAANKRTIYVTSRGKELIPVIKEGRIVNMKLVGIKQEP